jgi:hypothetical protein
MAVFIKTDIVLAEDKLGDWHVSCQSPVHNSCTVLALLTYSTKKAAYKRATDHVMLSHVICTVREVDAVQE